jgi:hypothetical protein
LTFWPPIVCGISAIVFFSGMPSDAAGPVAETVTPTVMSACAMPVSAVAAAKAGGEEGVSCEGTWRVSVGVMGFLPGRRAHRADAAEEQVGDDRREVGMAQLALRLSHGEHPVHHAEEQHRQRLLQAGRGELGADRDDRLGERGDDAALAAEDALLLGRGEEADVLGQDAVLRPASRHRQRGRRRSGGAGAARARQRRIDLGDQRQQPRDVRLGDLGEQLVLVAHVVVERGLRDAARLGDLVHRRRRVAARANSSAARARIVSRCSS